MDDEILIHELEVEARIGVPDAERAQPQRLVLSIAMTPRENFGALRDDLRRTVDYAVVAEDVQAFVSGRVVKLIETLADELATYLLGRFGFKRIHIEVRKFILPDAKYVAVSVTRSGTP